MHHPLMVPQMIPNGNKKTNSLRELVNNLSNKQLFTFGIFLGCIAGFVYQASLTWKQYFEYNTISVVKLEEESTLEYPGVTYCVGEIISEKNLEQWYPDYVCLKRKYPKDQPEDVNLTCNNPSGRTSVNDLYVHYSVEATREKPIMELFGTDWTPICEMEMAPLTLNSVEGEKRLLCDQVSEVVESLSFIIDSKCFTYFSQLNKGI